MTTASADTVAVVLEQQPALAGRVSHADEVLVPAVSPPLTREHALGLELILEGFLLHHRSSRHVDDVSMGAAVLAGDYCYAQGLVRVARTGDLSIVDALADLVALSAAAVAAGRDDDLLPLWRTTVAQVAGDDAVATGDVLRARDALRDGDPSPVVALAAALPEVPGLAEALAR